MPGCFLVISRTTTARLGNLHPQDWEPTIPFHTHGGCVMYILHFPLFLYVQGWGTHLPSGELEIPLDHQHRTGSQHFVFSPGCPRRESHFPSTPAQLPHGGKTQEKLAWWECQNPLGEQDLLFCLSRKLRTKEVKDGAICN